MFASEAAGLEESASAFAVVVAISAAVVVASAVAVQNEMSRSILGGRDSFKGFVSYNGNVVVAFRQNIGHVKLAG